MSPRSRVRKPPKKAPARRPRPSGIGVTDEERAALTPRYTPPLVLERRRQPWHRWLGWLQVAAGVALIILNYAQDFGPRLLPGGHNELYFLLGVATAGGGTWWLGVFDRPERVRR